MTALSPTGQFPQTPNRREWLSGTAASAALMASRRIAWAAASAQFQPRYLLASCLYGYAPLQDILPQVAKTGATAIDLWPKIHGNQREQLDEMGEAEFTALLNRHNTRLGCITQFALGPFQLQEEIRLAARLGCRTIVTGARGPANLKGQELKSAVEDFARQMMPHLTVAEKMDVTIAIENHGHNLIESPDAIQWLADLRPSAKLAIALAPYHLPQDTNLISKLIGRLGNRMQVFYAWQHGMGCMKKLPKQQELLQLPGRGDLDFAPLISALASINFAGWTEIFMHPVPRGVPILDTTEAVTNEVNRSRAYLADCQA